MDDALGALSRSPAREQRRVAILQNNDLVCEFAPYHFAVWHGVYPTGSYHGTTYSVRAAIRVSRAFNLYTSPLDSTTT